MKPLPPEPVSRWEIVSAAAGALLVVSAWQHQVIPAVTGALVLAGARMRINTAWLAALAARCRPSPSTPGGSVDEGPA